ncbi:hypothetical protein L2755_06910 [Shewanella abyssi]|uniref:hypothetical protein n=1 Tax=Shewanella abyssi TaxID=311789 RepID=UPI00200E6AF3|nr:hypothetical protein [Shewanella abyssi]MCL1049266.1 hypothetical protein [Shewanella abyssi]MCL1049355.1 hypothetical protein [Shewanella abyssi]
MKNQTNNQATDTVSNTISVPVHSNATLLKASIVATVIAAVVLVMAILPAEYNIDPTGIGKSLGLTEIATAATAAIIPSAKAATNVMKSTDSIVITDAPSVAEIKQARVEVPGLRQDTVDIVIAAGKGLEYKLLINENQHLEYEWRTDGAPLYFDFHGEPQGDTTGFFESFTITTSDQVKGTLTTPFAGSHGWYWKNKTSEPITVTLTTKGAYLIKG